MSDPIIERLTSRVALYVRAAKTHLANGQRTDARRLMNRAQATLEVLTHARLVAAVAQIGKGRA